MMSFAKASSVALISAILLFNAPSFAAEELTDAQIRQALIEQSLSAYPGNCPCPYNTDRAGRSCGRRSAYSKPGGASPLCYPDDITAEMIEQYRQHRAN